MPKNLGGDFLIHTVRSVERVLMYDMIFPLSLTNVEKFNFTLNLNFKFNLCVKAYMSVSVCLHVFFTGPTRL